MKTHFVIALVGAATLANSQFVLSEVDVVHIDGQPYGMSFVDFNNDALADVAVSVENSDKVEVYWNNGLGGFDWLGATYFLGTSTGPRDVVHADFDLDGDYDLAVALSRHDVIRLLLNDGTGAFNFGPVVGTGLLPTKLQAADLDGDDDQDLVALNRDAGSVSVLLNNGGGASFTQTAYPVALEPRDLQLGDFDNDGDQDFVVANLLSASATVYYNLGNGSFSGRQDLPTIYPFLPYDVDVADIDNDGIDDFVFAGWGDGGGGNRVYGVNVFRSIGGSFQAPVFYSLRLWAGFEHESLTLADFDTDGDIDILGSAQANGSLDFLTNDGNGTFSPANETYGGNPVTEMMNGDINGDLKPDVLMTHLVSGGGIGAHVDYFLNETGADWAQIMPTSYSLERGVVVTGDLPSIQSSNNQYLQVKPGVTFSSGEYPIRIIVDGSVGFGSSTQLKVGLELHVSALGIKRQAQIFNFSSNQWEELDLRTARRGDDMLWFDVPDPAAHIQHGSQTVRLKVNLKATRPVFAYPWTARLDRIAFATK